MKIKLSKAHQMVEERDREVSLTGAGVAGEHVVKRRDRGLDSSSTANGKKRVETKS